MADTDFSLPPLSPPPPPPLDETAVHDIYGVSLYGSSNMPSSSDADQDRLSNCYFMGDAIAIADQQPDTIRNAIQFNPADGSFDVTLYQRDLAGGRGADAVARVIHVTKADIDDNIKRGGGSSLDNPDPGYERALWPAVLETAYAKMNDSNPANGLDEGYQRIANGGSARDAMFTLTGQPGKEFLLQDGEPINGVSREDLTFTTIHDALRDKRPVVLSTANETLPAGPDGIALELLHDGLMDHHTYSVSSIYRDDKGVVQVDLINPVGHNRGDGREAEPLDDNMITVPLSQIASTGRDSIILGARPRDVGRGAVPPPPLPVASLPRPLALTGSAQPPAGESSLDFLQRKGNELLNKVFGAPSHQPPPLPRPPPPPLPVVPQDH